jgi:HPt (histidine-containing phosphotransfer) domain-containing protein
MRNQDEQTAYFLNQASRCAKAASTASAAELGAACANLEQGWLQLVPRPAEGESADRTPTPTKSRRAAKRSR